MAIQQPGFSIGFLKIPSTAFSTKQHTVVVAQSCQGFVAAPSCSASMLGVMQDAPTVAGEAVNVMTEGVTKVKFQVSIAAGLNYIVGTSGMIASTGSAAAGASVYGPVLFNPGTTGAIGSVLLKSVGVTT